VELVVAHQLLQGDVVGSPGSRDLEPRRLAIDHTWQTVGMSWTRALQLDEGRVGHN